MELLFPLHCSPKAQAHRYADQPVPLRTRFAGMATTLTVCGAIAFAGLWQAQLSSVTLSEAPTVTAMTMAPLAAPPPSEKPSGEPQEAQESAAEPEQNQVEPVSAAIPPPVTPIIQHLAAADARTAASSLPTILATRNAAPSADAARDKSRNSERQQASAPPAISAPPAQTASAEQERWESQILAALNRVKYYPREATRRRQEGISWICITVDQRGKVRSVRLQKGSGHRVLDHEALAMANRANPLPRPPATLKMRRIEVTVPITFSIDQA